MDLSDMRMTEVREFAKSMGVPPQQHESRESLTYRLSKVLYPDQKVPVKVESKAVALTPVWVTADEVLAKVQPYTDRGLVTSFSDDDKTWHFKCRGADDSGSMSMPISVIVRKAEMVAKGGYAPRIIKEGDLAGALA